MLLIKFCSKAEFKSFPMAAVCDNPILPYTGMLYTIGKLFESSFSMPRGTQMCHCVLAPGVPVNKALRGTLTILVRLRVWLTSINFDKPKMFKVGLANYFRHHTHDMQNINHSCWAGSLVAKMCGLIPYMCRTSSTYGKSQHKSHNYRLIDHEIEPDILARHNIT